MKVLLEILRWAALLVLLTYIIIPVVGASVMDMPAWPLFVASLWLLVEGMCCIQGEEHE